MIKFIDDTDGQVNDYQRLTKPLIEKRRRARINLCLMQLKEMVIDSGRHHIQNPKCKYEKADILELTVDYLENMHLKQQLERNRTNQSFNSGFQTCLKQVEQFLRCLPLSDKHNNNEGLDCHQISRKLLTHLDYCRYQLTNNNINDNRTKDNIENKLNINNTNTNQLYDQNFYTPNNSSVIHHTSEYSSSPSSNSSTISPLPSPDLNKSSHSCSPEFRPNIRDIDPKSLEMYSNETNGQYYQLEGDGVWRPW